MTTRDDDPAGHLALDAAIAACAEARMTTSSGLSVDAMYGWNNAIEECLLRLRKQRDGQRPKPWTEEVAADARAFGDPLILPQSLVEEAVRQREKWVHGLLASARVAAAKLAIAPRVGLEFAPGDPEWERAQRVVARPFRHCPWTLSSIRLGVGRLLPDSRQVMWEVTVRFENGDPGFDTVEERHVCAHWEDPAARCGCPLCIHDKGWQRPWG